MDQQANVKEIEREVRRILLKGHGKPAENGSRVSREAFERVVQRQVALFQKNMRAGNR
ncbi:MAG: hypothetical protein IH851_12335 [Armatimonadetes bacterium]|nr:hypothetical protein [Armatimonadota bacterium]